MVLMPGCTASVNNRAFTTMEPSFKMKNFWEETRPIESVVQKHLCHQAGQTGERSFELGAMGKANDSQQSSKEVGNQFDEQGHRLTCTRETLKKQNRTERGPCQVCAHKYRSGKRTA